MGQFPSAVAGGGVKVERVSVHNNVLIFQYTDYNENLKNFPRSSDQKDGKLPRVVR